VRVSRLLICAATSLGFFVSASSVSTLALAQSSSVSDADRKAARDLFFQGVELQDAGKFADALDKFQRAQSVISAPTTMLHIAECEAAMNKLVEAAETYRAVGRFPMPANPPQPFVAAQSQAAGELKQLEPRIPEITVEVTPPNIPTLQVSVDDQPINNALVGVSRPLNPGSHKIVAQAPGYSREEKVIDVKERSRQKVPLELKATGGVTYGPAGTTPPAGTPAASAPAGGAQKPAPYDAKKAPEPRSKMSLLLGLRVGAAIPTGEIPLNNGNLTKIGQYSAPGGAIGLEAAFRFVRVIYVGALLQAEGYGDGSAFRPTGTDRSASGGIGALTAGWISNPDGFGVVLNAGVGYRWYSLEDSVAIAGTTQKVSESSSGTVFQLGFGLHIHAGKILRLIPKAEVDFGSLENSNPDTGLAAARAKTAFVFLGLSGLFDINLDRSVAH
jgi:hypothetical protein